jgi:protein phosphatase
MTSPLRPSADGSRILAASVSLQGKRNSNQDRILVFPALVQSESIVAAVADGLGGMQAGDKAAEIAIHAVEESVERLIDNMNLSFIEASEFLLDVYDTANDRIRQYAETFVTAGAVGTTLTTLIVWSGRYLVAHIGDSRCYLIDDTGIRQITQDHTLADELLRQGSLNEQDYGSSPFRNQLTRSLGPRQSCEPDLLPKLHFGEVDRDCTFLLCSDGFYSKLGDQDLCKAGTASPNLQQVLDGLAAEALNRHSSDNLSAIAVRYSKL